MLTATDTVTVVANEAAGSADRLAVRRAVESLRTRSAATVAVHWTSDTDALDGVLRRSDGLVVSAGGDGSLHAVVGGLHRLDRLDRPVAVLPLGTGNDVAGALGLDDIDDAVDAIVGGRIEAADLVETDHGVAVNALHLGIGAAAAERATPLKSFLGPLAYPVGAVAVGLRFRPWRATITVDGAEVARGRFVMVALANGRRVGGGVEIAPDASPDDGAIDLVWVEDAGLRGRIRLASAIRRGEHLALPEVHHRRGRRVIVTGDPVDGNIDGELFGPVTELRARTRPGALQLVRRPGGGRHG